MGDGQERSRFSSFEGFYEPLARLTARNFGVELEVSVSSERF